MDIVLPTKSDDYLGFRSVERFSAHAGFSAELVVRVRGFRAQLRFAVEPEPFVAFITALEQMSEKLNGKARLKPIFEHPYLDFELEHTGKVRVSGDLVAYGPPTQRLRFEFTTDQTAIGPFARDLRSYISAQPANEP